MIFFIFKEIFFIYRFFIYGSSLIIFSTFLYGYKPKDNTSTMTKEEIIQEKIDLIGNSNDNNSIDGDQSNK